MESLSQVVFEPVHLPFTVLLILVTLYWATVLIGVLDLDTFDIDLDGEADIDLELDSDVPAMSAGMAIAKFFHLGDMPLMIVLTILSFSSWTASILLNYHFNADLSSFQGLFLLVPNLALSIIVLKIVAKPLGKVFQTIQKDLKSETQMLGMPCIVTTSKVNATFGQAKLQTETSPILFNAIAKEGEELKKGDQGVILEYNKEKNTYLITAFK